MVDSVTSPICNQPLCSGLRSITDIVMFIVCLFVCAAPSHIPGDILRVVMHRMGQKFRDLRTFNPMAIAPVLEEAGLITYEQFYTIRNPHTRFSTKLDELNEGLYHSGKQAETLVRFYHCLIDSASQCPTHAHLAREMRQHGKL